MITLLLDIWFYLLAGGFLLSAFCFVFLLKRYRLAVEMEDEQEPEHEVSDITAFLNIAPAKDETSIPPVLTSSQDWASAEVPEESLEETEQSQPTANSTPSVAMSNNQTMTGQQSDAGESSPAVIYLQNLKEHFEMLDQNVHDLKSLASEQTSQGKSILKILGELSDKIQQLEQRVSIPLEPAPLIEPSKPEPKVSAPPVEELKVAVPVAQLEPTIILGPRPGVAVESSAPVEAPPQTVVQKEEAAPSQTSPRPRKENKPLRKGPVWPI